MDILSSRRDPRELTMVGPAGNGLTLVEMLLVDAGADKYWLAKAILRRWFWPRDPRPADGGP